jgi:hypothetical protein
MAAHLERQPNGRSFFEFGEANLGMRAVHRHERTELRDEGLCRPAIRRTLMTKAALTIL